MATSNPSTTTATPSDGTSTPTSASSSDSDTASLYLFTFLATILILVLLSASLILRSYILRRRYRQHFQQAFTTGLFTEINNNPFNEPGQFDSLAGFRRQTRRSGPKPVLWDTWSNPPDEHPTRTWSSLTPISVRCSPTLSPPSRMTSSPPSTAPRSPPSQTGPRPSFLSQFRLPSPFSHSPRSSSSPVDASSSHPNSRPQPNTCTEKDASTLSVCVLIAMPDVSFPVHRPVTSSTKGKGVDPQPLESHTTPSRIPHVSSEEELPVLEFGVAEVGAGEWAWTM